MEYNEVMKALEAMGSEQIRKIFRRHGAPDNMFGVKVGDMKTLVREIKRDHALAMELYRTGNSDAMYLAGLIADPMAFTPEDLQEWAERAPWYMISEYTVPWMAAESPHGMDMARRWITSPTEHIAAAGWTTWSCILALMPDNNLDKDELRELSRRVEAGIAKSPNRVRYAMNGFIIALGCYVPDLFDMAIETAEKIGFVSVDMNGTACKVPDAVEYIRKVERAGKKGKKKKTVIC